MATPPLPPRNTIRYSQQKKRLNEERKGKRRRLRKDEQISLGFVDRENADDFDDGGTNKFRWGVSSIIVVEDVRSRRPSLRTLTKP